MYLFLPKLNNKSYGYTLIEFVIVIAIFLFVIAASIGIFISIFIHQKRVLAEQQLLYQISYAEEYISKALRMATADTSGSCLGEKDFIYLLDNYNPNNESYHKIIFLNQSDINNQGMPVCQEIYFEKNDPNCIDQPNVPCPMVLKEIKDFGDPVNLTSTDLKINFAKFIIDGDINHNTCSAPCGVKQCSQPPCIQPRVTIVFDVQLPGENQPARRFQTTVSQRNLNAP